METDPEERISLASSTFERKNFGKWDSKWSIKMPSENENQSTVASQAW